MKMHVIGALLASTAFATSAYAAGETKLMTVTQFCAEQRLSAVDFANCENELNAATTDEERVVIMRSYEIKPNTSTPLRNDLRANDAGVKRAEPSDGAIERTLVGPSTTTIIVPSGSSTTLGVVEPMPEPMLESTPAPSTPLRNDLRSDEAGVKGAKQSTDPRLN